jgi:S-formylglutathione hydrolase
VPGDDASWDFGLGAGFYVDATEAPWCGAYRMERYVTRELVALVEAQLPIARDRAGSSGTPWAATARSPSRCATRALRQRVGASRPSSRPREVPWGHKAFAGYLGTTARRGAPTTQRRLLAAGGRLPGEVLVDQGLDDKFLARELQPERLERVCAEVGQAVTVRRHAGYDHSYFFVMSFVEDHLRLHARALPPGR